MRHRPLTRITFHTIADEEFLPAGHALDRPGDTPPELDIIDLSPQDVGAPTLFLSPTATIKLRDVLNTRIASRQAQPMTPAATIFIAAKEGRQA
jgi:hypothetical protein